MTQNLEQNPGYDFDNLLNFDPLDVAEVISALPEHVCSALGPETDR